MRDGSKVKAAEAASPDYAMFLTGLRVAQATSPTAQAQSTLAEPAADATPQAGNAFLTARKAADLGGSYRSFSKVTNGKRT